MGVDTTGGEALPVAVLSEDGLHEYARHAAAALTDLGCVVVRDPEQAVAVLSWEPNLLDGMAGGTLPACRLRVRASRRHSGAPPGQVCLLAASHEHAAVLRRRDLPTRLPVRALGVAGTGTSAWRTWAAATADEILRRRRLPSLVMLTPVAPSKAGHESAGEQLVRRILEVQAEGYHLTIVGAEGPGQLRCEQRGLDEPLLLLPQRHTGGLEWVRRALAFRPVLAPSWLARIAGLVKAADRIDLQWEEQGFLIGAFRAINPDATVSSVLHDVVSQRCERRAHAAQRPSRRVVWAARAVAAKALEAWICRRADQVIVLSDKDRDLLPHRRRAEVEVLRPSIDGADRGPGRPAGEPPTVVSVGYLARDENTEGLRWYAEQVWPRVRAALPEVRTLVAGGGAQEGFAAEMRAAGLTMLGFCDDLEAVYGRADAVIVALHQGAGVKFKTVEALVRAIPVVSTETGAEGIGHRPTFAAITDDAQAFATALIAVLRHPEAAWRRAREGAPAVRAVFGPEAFAAEAARIYGVARRD
ncbi:MAG: glycosyltransferase [Bowdeniella nasicola]|nr:glycosyltransferase [Bowdeniella nasicola]